MNERCFFFFLLIFTSFLPLLANEGEIDEKDFGSEEITQPAKQTPFHVSSYVDAIGKSKISKGFFKGDEIHFAIAQAQLGSIFYYCPNYTEGMRLSLGFAGTYVGWQENPWFDQEHFNTLSLNFTGFSKRLERWFWRSQLSINMDTDQWSAQYTSYDVLLWGRYTYFKTIGIHLGVWVQTGLRLDRVLPILGVDWQISPDWKLNLVYPVNLSLEYQLSQAWSLALAVRHFSSRFRIHPHCRYSKSLLRYNNVGGEFAIKYEWSHATANFHIGYTVGGKYRVANRHNHHADNYKFEPAPYIGGEVDIRF